MVPELLVISLSAGITVEKEVPNLKDVYVLATCADESPDAIEGVVKGVQGWVDCLPGTRIAGTLCATGLPVDRDIRDTGFLEKAYEMGRSL